MCVKGTVFEIFCVGIKIKSMRFPMVDYVRGIKILLIRLPGMSITLLYFVLASTARFLFKDLEDRLLSYLDGNNIDKNKLFLELEEWRCHYEMTRHLADQLNNNFRLILLVNLIFNFASSIRSFFEFVLGHSGTLSLHYLVFNSIYKTCFRLPC